MLAREDVEVHLHAPQTKTEHFWLYVWQIVNLKNCNIVRKQHLDLRMHVATSNFHIVTGSNSTIQSKYRTSRLLDIAAQIITDLVPCFTVGTRHDVGNNEKDDSSDHIIYFQLSEV